MSESRPLRIFLCHASTDKPAVRLLYKHLKENSLQPWLDAENLLPGQNWQAEIPQAVRNSDVVLVCLSCQSVNKEGYVQKEIKFALDFADEKPEGTIFVVPVRLEDCPIPERLNIYQWVNLFEPDGYNRLLLALKARADQIGALPPRGKGVFFLPRSAPMAENIVGAEEQSKLEEPASQKTPQHPKIKIQPAWGIALVMLVVGIAIVVWGKPSLEALFVSTPTLTVTDTRIPASPTDSFFPTSTQSLAPTPKSSWKQGRIVYVVRNAENLNDITMQDMTANTVPRLLLASRSDQMLIGPNLSPDSSKVVYYDGNGGNNGILDLQTLAVHEFLACNSPSFSSDGSQIICGGGDLFHILNAKGDTVGSLALGQAGRLPVFSPDGTEVAYAVQNGNFTSIWKISSVGGQAIALATDATENYGPRWSPDGQRIAYQSGDGSGTDNIWVMDRNGGNKQQITHLSGKFARAPVWSPNGEWLAFVSSKDNSVGTDFGDVYVVSLSTLEVTQVTHTGGNVLDWRVSWGP